MSNAVATPVGPTSSGADARVSVPLLAELLTAEDRRRRVWADLGGAQGGLTHNLSGKPSHLLVADLPRALLDGQAQWYLPDSILPGKFWREPVDRFLCWDLLNYMNGNELGALSTCLARHGANECRVHALIQYSGKQMSECPARFTLDGDLRLIVDEVGPSRRQAPRYSPKALEKAMPDLRVERTLLLNNGMQEFLFGLR